jgi:hypothetical protein
MKKHIVKFAALALLGSLFMTSCQKDSVETDDAQISAAQSSSETSGMVEDMSDEAEFRLSPSTLATGCPTITYAVPQGQFPNTITIDFGTGCTGRNGRVIAGQIIVDITNDYFAAGSVRTTHTEDLTVDGNSLAYTRTVTNQGVNGVGQMYWTVEVTGTRARATDGSTGTWTASRVRTLIEGQESTEDMLDDVYEITGSGTGTCPEGRSFTTTITTPLVKRADCRWIVSGVEQFTVDGRTGTRTLDFGDGSCDDKGTITTRNGATREITLQRPR